MEHDRSGSDASIQDVARAAGVAPSTVSRVLNHATGAIAISPATAERVRAAATALHYVPNAFARSLRTNRSQTVGVIVRDLTHPFTAELLKTIYAACRARDYHLLIGHAVPCTEEGAVLGDILSRDRVDGLLLAGDVLQQPDQEAAMCSMLALHRHVVSIGCRPSDGIRLALAVDSRAGVTMALEYLVSLGHRSIAYVRGDAGSTTRQLWENEQRLSAFCEFMIARDLGPPRKVCVAMTPDALQASLTRLLQAEDRPTALFVEDDWTAIMLLKAATSCGIRVPEDFSIVGFDDIAMSTLCMPGLTTVRQPIDLIGRTAADALLDLILGAVPALPSTPGNEVVLFPPSLIVRDSCRSLAPVHVEVTSAGKPASVEGVSAESSTEVGIARSTPEL